MKLLPLLLVALTTPLTAAESNPPVSPQPRVRLQNLRGAYVARVDISVAKVPEAKPVVMDKMVVGESKLPPVPRSEEQPAPKRFSPLLGGPIYSGKIGSLPMEIGMWPSIDIFAEEARFKPQKTRVDIDVVRIKW